MIPTDQTLLSILRSKNSSLKEFRHASHAYFNLIAHATMGHIQTLNPTPEDIVLVPLLRSGIAMLTVFLEQFKNAAVSVIGIQRDEHTASNNMYYANIVKPTSATYAIILDPMLATGGTACTTINALIKQGYTQNQIIFVGLISAPQGIKAIKQSYPHVTIIIAVQDNGLDEDYFIVPGLGDFGDRYFGT